MPHSEKMFGPLEGYRDAAFCRAHPTLRFDTLTQAGEYRVVAVLLTRVYRQGEEGFRYYAETDFQMCIRDRCRTWCSTSPCGCWGSSPTRRTPPRRSSSR